MIYIIIVLLILIILTFIISYLIFNMALNRNASKASVLDSDLNNKVTEDKPILPKPDVNWLNKNAKEVTINSFDNLKLQGYVCLNNSNRWIILVHGYASNHEAMINRGKKLYDLGYSILLIDLRAHGKSEGKYIAMGTLDAKDVKSWINFLIRSYKVKEICLFGISMGAATVMTSLGLDLPDEVKFAIEDCGYSSVWDEFKYQLNNLYHLPTFPFLYICEIYARSFAGYNFKSYSAIKSISKTKIPLLLIHGTNDTFVPYHMLDINYNNCHSEKEKLIVENANHTEAEDLAYDKYWQTIINFIKKNK